jgi:hypothetical protein
MHVGWAGLVLLAAGQALLPVSKPTSTWGHPPLTIALFPSRKLEGGRDGFRCWSPPVRLAIFQSLDMTLSSITAQDTLRKPQKQ